MTLKIVVCVKPIPDPEYYKDITIDPVKKTIQREGIPTIINPADKHAIEEALKIKEKFGGKIIIVSMAPPHVIKNIYDALAMGADEAYLLTDKKFAGSDTWGTSYILAKAIEKIGGIDLVITGTETGDGGTSQVPSQLGEWLKIPHLWNVIEFKIKNKNDVYLKTKIENGFMEWTCQLPMAIAVSREMNTPRYTTIMGVMKAKKKPFQKLTCDDLYLDEKRIGLVNSPTQAGNIYMLDLSRKGKIIKGTKEELAQFIIDHLKASGINVEANPIICSCEGETDNE